MLIKSIVKKPNRLKTLWANRDKIARGIAVSMFIALSLATVVDLVKWHDKNEIHFQSPITLKPPVYAELRKLTVIQEVQAAPNPNNSPLTPIQQYICNKFGDQCKTAIAVSMAESRDNCNEINVNSNGTVDFSIFQENSVHLNKQFTLQDLGSCEKMVDRAYELYQKQGWTPWSSYQNKSYTKFLW